MDRCPLAASGLPSAGSNERQITPRSALPSADLPQTSPSIVNFDFFSSLYSLLCKESWLSEDSISQSRRQGLVSISPAAVPRNLTSATRPPRLRPPNLAAPSPLQCHPSLRFLLTATNLYHLSTSLPVLNAPAVSASLLTTRKNNPKSRPDQFEPIRVPPTLCH